MISVKGNLFLMLCANIYICRYLLFTMETWIFLWNIYEYFDACQALKEVIWLRKFLHELKVVERVHHNLLLCDNLTPKVTKCIYNVSALKKGINHLPC